MYHRVTEDKQVKDKHITVTPQAFEQQMQFLQENDWQVIPLSEALSQLQSGCIKHSNQLVLTFDDGYRDNYDIAYPILKKYQFPATIYLITSLINCDPYFLSLAHLTEMFEGAITYGSHSITHPNLTEISLEESWKELGSSKIGLESALGYLIKTFAYPSGYFNSIHQQMLGELGYSAALTIAPGGNTCHDSLFALKRTEISFHDSLLDFKNKLRGGFDWAHQLAQQHSGLYPVPQQPIQRIS